MCGPQQASCSTLDTGLDYCLDVPDTRLFDCNLLVEQCACPIPQAEPDIAGIRVLIAFLFSAFFTWIAAVAYLVLKPPSKPLRMKRTNKFDEIWTRNICEPIRKRFKKCDIWAECFLRVTFALSDQQLVTGIAILIAGFKLLGDGNMTAYPFSIVRDLAFFSSESHLLSLLALWSAFRSERLRADRDKGSGRLPVPTVTIIRFFLMVIFLGLLLSATWITAFSLHDDWARCPVRCVLQQSHGLGGVPLRWAIASTIFLIMQYSGIMLQLSETILGRYTMIRRFAHLIGKRLHGPLQNSAFRELVCQFLRSIVFIVRFYWFSEAFVVVEVMAWFMANCVFAAQNRAASRDVFGDTPEGMDERKKEDDMGFGQIVPLLLLVLPFMTFISTYHERMELEHARNRYYR